MRVELTKDEIEAYIKRTIEDRFMKGCVKSVELMDNEAIIDIDMKKLEEDEEAENG